jgi:NAD-dependent SIR2 family protein deacetylase
MKHAAKIISEAESIIITAGAGMGVDSGLPDFRGDQGFWKAYPYYAAQGISFVDAATAKQFSSDPAFAWGFYGHRANLYQNTSPHDGFYCLKRWIQQYDKEYFVVTSNVDGQFQKAGFDENHLLEIHGSIHWLQCAHPCCRELWENHEIFKVDTATMRASRYPVCPFCDEVSRPNILMFDDSAWISDRKNLQLYKFRQLRERNKGRKTVVIEIGAGTAIPTIRNLSEEIGSETDSLIIRINPRKSEVTSPHISLPRGAMAAICEIDKSLDNLT